MDTFQIFIYIVVAIVYFLINARKKKTAPPVSGPLPKNTGTPQTFQELLEQLTNPEQSKPQPKKSAPTQLNPQKTKKAEVFEDSEDTLLALKEKEDRIRKVQEEKEQMLAEIAQRRQTTVQNMETLPTYENYDQSIDEYVKKYEATPDYESLTDANQAKEPTRYKGLNVDKSRFDEFDLKVEAEHPLVKVFRNPQAIQQAFIISEILNRRES
jgi:hypothetical protein